MTTKTVMPLVLSWVAICFCSQPTIKAGSPAIASNDTTATGTLTGVVRFDGKLPRPTTINMTADPNCAKQHHSPILSQEVVTDVKGGLQNVIVFVADGLGDGPFDQPGNSVVIEQKGCMYQPHVLAMRANQPVELVNHDPMFHNIHPLPTRNREWNKAEAPGSRAEGTFSREEIAIPVKCNIHPWMRGYVAVFRHPYFAVTSENGKFELRGLPPGTYLIKAWHEKLGTATQRITVRANETKVVDFAFKPQA